MSSYLSKIKNVALRLAAKPVSIASQNIVDGIINPNMTAVPQVDFLRGVRKSEIHVNNDIDSSYATVSGTGAIYTPSTKDHYMGEVL
jgi:hypothetical protein